MSGTSAWDVAEHLRKQHGGYVGSNQDTSKTSLRRRDVDGDSRTRYSGGLQRFPTRTLYEEGGSIASEPPMYPEHKFYYKRLKTFEKWPETVKTSPEELAKAGFFYTGYDDRTICFQCGGKLHSWKEEDIPFEEHEKWYKDCSFVRLNLGSQTIEESQRPLHQENEPALDDQLVEERLAALVSEDDVEFWKTYGVGKVLLLKAVRLLLKQKKDVDVRNKKDISQAVIKLTSGGHTSSNNTSVAGNSNMPNQENSYPSTTNTADVNGINLMDENKTCIICLDSQRDIVFLPCHHIVCCVLCGTSIEFCPVCRGYITSRMKVFMP